MKIIITKGCQVELDHNAVLATSVPSLLAKSYKSVRCIFYLHSAVLSVQILDIATLSHRGSVVKNTTNSSTVKSSNNTL